MKSIRQYNFYKTKYGDELLIDVVELRSIEKYIQRDPTHKLTYYDITLITEGQGAFHLNDCACKFQPDVILCSIPGDIRAWQINQTVNGYALIFEEEFLISFFNDAHFLNNLSYLHPQRNTFCLHVDTTLATRLHQLFQQIKTEIDIPIAKDHHMLRALLYEVLIWLNRAFNQSGNIPSAKNRASNRHIHAFTQFVNMDCCSQRNTQYYADKLCITANYLNEVVQNAYGISAKLYIQNKVMQEAKKLLIYTTFSISEIADKLNYSTPSYFVRSFHRHTGLTPTQFRERKNHDK